MSNSVNYVVKLLRADGQIIDLVETIEFSMAKEVWKNAYLQWTESVSERRPFIVEEPSDNGFITAFDPSLIKEITIVPVEVQKQTDNPYKRRMNQQGFTATFPTIQGDILDGGYS